MKSLSYRFDIEARVPDTDRDRLGADTSSAARFGAVLRIASGSARLFGPEGVRRSRRVRGEGARVSGERQRVMPEAPQSAITGGGVSNTPPPKTSGHFRTLLRFVPKALESHVFSSAPRR